MRTDSPGGKAQLDEASHAGHEQKIGGAVNWRLTHVPDDAVAGSEMLSVSHQHGGIFERGTPEIHTQHAISSGRLRAETPRHTASTCRRTQAAALFHQGIAAINDERLARNVVVLQQELEGGAKLFDRSCPRQGKPIDQTLPVAIRGLARAQEQARSDGVHADFRRIRSRQDAA